MTFEFTGTISNTIFKSGLKKTPWNGQSVSGNMFIDIEGLATNPNLSPKQSYYSSHYGDNPADWLSFTLNNPDGTTYSFPGGFDPLPEVDVDGSSAYLTYDFPYNGTSLYAGRTFANRHNGPVQVMSLRMKSRGINAAQMLNGIDFNTVEFRPEFADWENYGYVDYAIRDGVKFEYYFTIDSITRVPAPSSWALLICGIFAMIWARRQHATRQQFI